MLGTPVLFLVFNRPDSTSKVFEQIRKAQPRYLYVAADGPRDNVPGEKQRCEDVRKIATAVDWNCEIRTLFRKENLGCGKAVSSAISWFFDNVEEGIILEDDTLPSESFFPFCEALLEKYKDNEKVGYINGCNLGYKLQNDRSYGFTKIMNMWGWASWRRSISTVDYTMQTWKELPDKRSFLKEVFSDQEERNQVKTVDFFINVFDKTSNGLIDTWDYQHIFTNFLNDKVCIFPAENLIVNLGFGVNATHTTFESAYISNLKHNQLKFPLNFSGIIERETKYELLFLERWGQVQFKPRIYYNLQDRLYKLKKRYLG